MKPASPLLAAVLDAGPGITWASGGLVGVGDEVAGAGHQVGDEHVDPSAMQCGMQERQFAGPSRDRDPGARPAQLGEGDGHDGVVERCGARRAGAGRVTGGRQAVLFVGVVPSCGRSTRVGAVFEPCANSRVVRGVGRGGADPHGKASE